MGNGVLGFLCGLWVGGMCGLVLAALLRAGAER
jgi:hypothetical protein